MARPFNIFVKHLGGKTIEMLSDNLLLLLLYVITIVLLRLREVW